MKKQYSKPEVEMIVFRYTDVMASSGDVEIEYGVDEEEGEIGGGPLTSVMPQNSNAYWNTEE